MTASDASASTAGFSLPPVFSSPRPNRKYRPKPSRWAAACSEGALTSFARPLESCPSLQSGNEATRCSLTSRVRTASPRNSSFSLSPAAASSWPRELCVSACSSHSSCRKRWPSAASSSACSVSTIFACPSLFLGRGGLRRGESLGLVHALLATLLQRPGGLRAMPQGYGRIRVAADILVRQPEHIEIHRVGIRSQLGGLLEFRRRFGEFLPVKLHQAQPAVTHGELLVFCPGEVLVGHVRRLLHRCQQADGLVRVPLRLLEFLVRIERPRVNPPWHHQSHQGQDVHVVRIQLERLLSRVEHFVFLSGREIRAGQPRVHTFAVAAFGIFLQELFAELDLSPELAVLGLIESLVRSFFLSVHGRRRRIRSDSRGLTRLRGRLGRGLLALAIALAVGGGGRQRDNQGQEQA